MKYNGTILAADNTKEEVQKADLDLLKKINEVAAVNDTQNTDISTLQTDVKALENNEITSISIDKVTYNLNSDLPSLTGTVNIDLSLSDIFNGLMAGNTTLTFSNLRRTTIRFIIQHSAASTYTLTFPSAYKIGVDGPNTTAFSLVGNATTRYSIFDVFYDGTRLFITQAKFSA